MEANYLRYTGDDHVLIGGTELADTLIASIGDDTLFGDGGNDRLEGGFGNDIINAGEGDDIIKDSGGDDNIKAGGGNDAVHAGPGLDLVHGRRWPGLHRARHRHGLRSLRREGNDFIFGNKNAERILGNEGNDWIETGTFDGAPGDNFDEIFAHDGIDGHDVFLGDGGFDEFIGEGGDDIMVGSLGRGKMAGMSGFDWATYKDNITGVNADLSIPIMFDEAPTLPQNAARSMNSSPWKGCLVPLSTTCWRAPKTSPQIAPRSAWVVRPASPAAPWTARASPSWRGCRPCLGLASPLSPAGDILLGGDGSDTIMGRGGDDIIDGDKWLDVQIGVYAPADVNHTGPVSFVVDSMKDLTARMFSGEINPGQLAIVRTIRTDDTNLASSDPLRNIDIAKYQGLRTDYTFGSTADGRVTGY